MHRREGLKELLNEIRSIRQYIGARYVPKFIDDPWTDIVEYEALSVVSVGGTSYISGCTVPVGTPISDRNYWHLYGATSGAIINLQNQIDDMKDPDVPGSLQEQISTNASDITALTNYIEVFVNALEIGFKNDGATDNSAAFTAMLSDPDYEGKTIFFPKGVYNIASTVTIDKRIKIIGEPDTIFKAVGLSMNYVFIVDFENYIDYFTRTNGNMFDTITIDCDNKCSGVALHDYLDLGFSNVNINNATVYGINTRPSEFVTNIGAQLNFENVRFYHLTNSNTATAIYDPSVDDHYNDIVVVGYKIAFEGAATINNLHHWLKAPDNFVGSATLKVKNGMYSNIYADTVEALIVPTNNSVQFLIEVANARIALNTSFVPSNDCYIVKYGTYTDANISIKNLMVTTDKCYGYDTEPTSTYIDGFTTNSNCNTYPQIIKGQISNSKVGAISDFAGANKNADDLHNAGVYHHDPYHKISGLPLGDLLTGFLIVIPIGIPSWEIQIMMYVTSKDVYYRMNQGSPSTWTQITHT